MLAVLGFRVPLCAAAMVATAAAVGVPSATEVGRSDLCGNCHRDIYRMWRSSQHARSLDDLVFLGAYRETRRTQGESVSRICLGCHAPAVDINGDETLQLQSTWEGVSCDVCHSLASVETTSGGAKPVYRVSEVKRGPIRGAESTGHETLFSELHTDSLACAPCHEFANPEGIPLLTTYSEWRQSSSARGGMSCQSCHMARTRANVVDPVVKRVPEKEVNLHEMTGGHSIKQLNNAIRMTITPRRSGDELFLDVELRNKGAGHAVPTGMPGRRLVLNVKLQGKGTPIEERRSYEKSYATASGERIERDSAFFGRGVKFVSDTRIQADEVRKERLRFPLPGRETGFLSVKLSYEHAPTGGEEDRTWITFLTEERILSPGK